MSYTRFAIYFVPVEDPLARFGASWIGWDVNAGKDAVQFDVAGLGDATATPRKYGFHGTLKPPFRLTAGQTQEALCEAVATMVSRTAPARCDGLELSSLGRFLALTPKGDASDIARLAAACVTEFDQFRAPARDAELTRRRSVGLSERQERLLTRWGYPYVMEEFRFHVTLTGKLDAAELERCYKLAEARLPELPEPFFLDRIALAGERSDGNFEIIQHYPLLG